MEHSSAMQRIEATAGCAICIALSCCADWDEQRREHLALHPGHNTTKQGQPKMLLITGARGSVCENDVGDFFNLRALKNKVDYCSPRGIPVSEAAALMFPSLFEAIAVTADSNILGDNLASEAAAVFIAFVAARYHQRYCNRCLNRDWTVFFFWDKFLLGGFIGRFCSVYSLSLSLSIEL